MTLMMQANSNLDLAAIDSHTHTRLLKNYFSCTLIYITINLMPFLLSFSRVCH
jgi:hypothetical protein